MMHPTSQSADEQTGGVLSRPNQQQAVRLLAEVLNEPLKDIVKEAVEEFESEQKSDDAAGESSSNQFALLIVLGFAAAIYLANKRGKYVSSNSEGVRSATESAESREQDASSDTTDTESSEASESDDRDDGEGDDEESE